MPKIHLTPQEAFDKAAIHLLTQNERCEAYKKGFCGAQTAFCAYRGIEGRKCAIGALIPDELYDVGMEERSVDYLIGSYNLFDYQLIRLLKHLQSTHDHTHPVNWRSDLINIADTFSLDAKVVYSFGDKQ